MTMPTQFWMGAGQLNRRVVLQAPTRVPDGQGGFTKGWSEGTRLWANMVPLRGGEALANSLLRGSQLWKVTVRWRAGVGRDDRLMHDGQPLNIRAVADPDGRRRWLVMTCEEGAKT